MKVTNGSKGQEKTKEESKGITGNKCFNGNRNLQEFEMPEIKRQCGIENEEPNKK